MPIVKVTLFDQVIEITNEYLGPAAERFITRQIETRLDKDPEKLNRKDLAELMDWIKLAMALLTDDKRIINEYMHSLSKLTGK